MKLLPFFLPKVSLALMFCCLTLGVSAQWVPIDGLPGGFVSDLKKGQNNVFATTNDGTFRSLDGGNNWEKITAVPDRVELVADGPNILVVKPDNMPPFGMHLFQSADDGFTWTEFLVTQSDSLGSNFQIFGPYVYAKRPIGSGTYRTKDFGQHWEFVSTEEFDFIPDGGQLYRSLGQALLVSSNGGFDWDTLSVLPMPIKLQIKTSNQILLSSWSVQQGAVVYYSADNGQSWKLMSVPPANQFEYNIFMFHAGKIFGFRKFSALAIVADPLVGNFVELPSSHGALGTFGAVSSSGQLLRSTDASGVVLSTDDGLTWHKSKGINTGATLRVQDNRMYATPGSGLYGLTADKQHWELLAPEFELMEVKGIAVKGQNMTIASKSGSIWVSSDGGQSFERGKNEDGSFAMGLYWMEAAGEELFGWDYGALGLAQPRYSVDFGKTWKSLLPFLNGMFVKQMWVSNDIVYIYNDLSLLFRWNPMGQTFEQIGSTPIPFQGTDEFGFLAPIWVHGSTYIVTEPSDTDSWNGAAAQYFVSTDAGQQWTEHPLGLSSIVSSGDTIFGAQFNSPVGYSTDQAASWQPFSEGMEGNARSLEIWEGEVFASTPLAVYRRGTNGASPSVPAFEPAQLAGFVVSPNPFFDQFTVELPSQTMPSGVRLYNLLGQSIELPQGNVLGGKIKFAGLGQLSPGTYFLEMEIEGERATQKLVKL